MASTVISANYPPLIDVTRTPLAYGNRAVPRLNRELNDSSIVLRRRALMSLCDYLHNPEHIAECLRAGIVNTLKTLLKDEDGTVRHKATECLYVIAGHAIGREAFVEDRIIEPVSQLFHDKEDIARKNAHLAIEMVSESIRGAEGIVEAGLVMTLVQRLVAELDEIKELILDTLHFCMIVDTCKALEANAMNIFTKLLSHNRPAIRAKAARDIMDLSVILDGKNEAVNCGTVEQLIKLLKDNCPIVRASAAGAIMNIAITTRGKYTAINGGALQPLVSLVGDSVSEVRVNALKALTCLSEAPEGRQKLLEHIAEIRALEHDQIPAVQRAATIAVKVITWKP